MLANDDINITMMILIKPIIMLFMLTLMLIMINVIIIPIIVE